MFASIMPFPSCSIFFFPIKFQIILSYLLSPSSLRERLLSGLFSDMFGHYICNHFALPDTSSVRDYTLLSQLFLKRESLPYVSYKKKINGLHKQISFFKHVYLGLLSCQWSITAKVILHMVYVCIYSCSANYIPSSTNTRWEKLCYPKS